MNQTETSSTDEDMTREAWKSVPADPDGETDLGYELADWEQFETLDDAEQLVFLPNSEAQLDDAVFVIAGTDSIVDLENQC